MPLPETIGYGGQMTEPISVFLVDDVPELRELIRFGMEDDPGFEVVGEAGDGRTRARGHRRDPPAAVLLDLSMPDMDGLEAIPEIREDDPDVAIIVLSGFSADRMSEPALRARRRRLRGEGHADPGAARGHSRGGRREARRLTPTSG